MKIEILEEAAAQAAFNLFKLKYPQVEDASKDARLQECINDTMFIVNNFMRISANLAENEEHKNATTDN